MIKILKAYLVFCGVLVLLAHSTTLFFLADKLLNDSGMSWMTVFGPSGFVVILSVFNRFLVYLIKENEGFCNGTGR